MFCNLITSSKASKISMLGWWIVQTMVRPVSATFFTALITMAAALASSPVVGSSMKMIDGFATNSTAIVSRFLCSVDNPLSPATPTKASLISSNSIVSSTCFTNSCKDWFEIGVELLFDLCVEEEKGRLRFWLRTRSQERDGAKRSR